MRTERTVPTPVDGWDVEAEIRDVTDAEVALFDEQGWIKLDGLLSAGLAAEILARAQAIMGPDAEHISGGGAGDPQFDHYKYILRNYLGAWKVDPLLSAVSHSRALGRVASRLRCGGDIRFFNDEVLAKMPAAAGGKPTPYHQDFPHAVFDRTALVNIWIAIADIPVARGSMRFLTGSHRAGPMGRTLLQREDVVEQQPWLLRRYPLSEPLALRPGDATVHTDLTIHGGPANESDAMRWAYLVNLFDADARYTGGPSYGEAVEGLDVNGLYDTPRYPITYEAPPRSH
jgi:hypothetical protein